jgi:hypothetical protein
MTYFIDPTPKKKSTLPCAPPAMTCAELVEVTCRMVFSVVKILILR